jgi:ribosome-associated toxin RatA of RatAB toxin-antitoxin module
LTARRADRYRPPVSDFQQSYSTTVDASAEDCFAVLTDFEAYPRWAGPVTECRVVDRHPDGLPRRVAFALDFTVKTIRYTLEYRYHRPKSAHWKLVEGDVKDVQGSYEFHEESGRTKATCSQAIDIGFWVPGPLRRPFEQKALRDSVEEFKVATETHAKRSGTAKA